MASFASCPEVPKGGGGGPRGRAERKAAGRGAAPRRGKENLPPEFRVLLVAGQAEVGEDLVHFGVVICLNMMIGLSTPPFGMLLFIVSGLGKTKIKGVIREILPMVLIMIGLLFLVTYVPDIIMFIPNNFM